MSSRFDRWRTGCLLVLVAAAAARVAAQDAELDAVLLLPPKVLEAGDVSTRSLQFFRVPLGFDLRDLDQDRWGLRLTLPVSFGLYEARAATNLEDLFARLQAVTVTPGVEVRLRTGPRWQVKPFGEIGVAHTTSGSTEVMYSAGVRAAGRYSTRSTLISVGGSARYANDRSSRVRVDDYTALEAGADLQWRLGFALGSRRAFGGVYGIARVFPGLSFQGTRTASLDVGQVYELGLSFSTDPVLEAWGIRLPWLAIGYRFGGLFSGVRISLSFPF